MLVAVDVDPILAGPSGIGTATRGLVEGLLGAGKHHRFVLVTRATGLRWSEEDLVRLRIVSDPEQVCHFPPPRIPAVFDRFLGGWPVELRNRRWMRALGVDVYLGTNYQVAAGPWAKVVVVWDLFHVERPELVGADRLQRLEKRLQHARAVADRFVVNSDSVRKKLLEWAGVQPGLVTVVPLGVDAAFRPEAEPGERDLLREHYRLPERYVLWVGKAEPRKNLEALLAVWRDLRPPDVSLVLAGPASRVVAGLVGPDRRGVLILPEVPSAHLPALYRGASLFVFPSLDEGFGLPVLEAMACGTPVVASRAGGLGEVVEDAGVLFDPGDPGQLGSALAGLLEDQTRRAELARRGMERAARFSWSRSGRLMLAVLEEAVAARAQSGA